jgi:predicted secreted hydrolase
MRGAATCSWVRRAVGAGARACWLVLGGSTVARLVRGAAALGWLALGGLALGAAWAAGPPASSDLDASRSGTGRGGGFTLAVEPRKFEFPRDHGPHADFRHEWWYVTGNLDSDSGERFGFELTFFRVGLVPPGGEAGRAVAGAAAVGAGGAAVGAGGAADAGVGGGRAGTPGVVSAWRTRQVYLAHFAITDVARGQFRFAEKFSRDALGLAGAQAEPFRVWLDDWVLGADATGWMLHADGQGYELTLDAQPLLDPVLNGEQGLSRKSSEVGAASYYYSIPRVAVHGKLAHAGRVSAVHGLAWLDREWGSGSLGTQQQGWDWFALQLQDGSALMFYAMRNHDGTRDSHSAGTWIDSKGRTRALVSDQVAIEVSDHWLSPGGGRYPSRWRVRIPAVGLDIEASPVLADQELRTKPRYWEGAVDVRGTQEGRDTSGRGYVELVGYGE